MTRREPKSNGVAEPKAYEPRIKGQAPASAANGNAAPIFQSLAVAEMEGGPRVRDLDLGERLGFDRPRNIRKLITRHMADLKKLGEVCSEWSKPGEVGRPSTTYFLNEEQAVYIAAKSDTETAANVTVLVVRTFVSYRRMQAAPQIDLNQALPALVDILVNQRLEADPRVAVLNYRLPITILKEAGVPPKGRRGFSNTIRGKLVRYCVDREIPMRRSPETDRQMFHVDAVNGWLKLEGNRLIADRLDQIGRQGVLKLVRS